LFGITEKKKKSAGLKIELTDSNEQVASVNFDPIAFNKQTPLIAKINTPIITAKKAASILCGVDTSRGGGTVKQLRESIRKETPSMA
jgi:hypothetical protein